MKKIRSRTISRPVCALPAPGFRWLGRPQILGLCLALTICNSALSAVPTLSDVFPRGLQIGETTRLKLSGTGLKADVRLLLPFEGEHQLHVVDATDKEVNLDVTLEEEAPAGIYPLRVVTEDGVSGAVMIGIDRLPQRRFQAKIVSLPVALHGELTGDQVRRASFEGETGQHVVIDVEGQRLGSKIRPVIRLHDAVGRQLAWSRPQARIAGDSRVEFVLPQTGQYEIELHDVIYKGPSPGRFRLKVGDLRFADLVFPVAIAADQVSEVEFVSSNIKQTTAVPGIATMGTTDRCVGWPDDPAVVFTGAAPRVCVSRLAEYRESDLGDKPVASLPAAINGRLREAGEEDQFVVQVSANEKLRLELHSERLGSPLDAVLVVSANDGKELGRSDDQSGTRDPGLDLDVPANVNEVRVRILSLTSQGGADHIYRLCVTNRQPKWKLSTNLDRVSIPSGGREVMAIDVDRGGSSGTLELRLPPALRNAVMLESGRVEPEDELGLIALRAARATRGVFSAAITGIDSSATIAHTPIHLVSGSFPGVDYQPALRNELLIAVTSAPSFSIMATDKLEGAELARGTKRPVTIRVSRGENVHGKVRLSLMSTQRTPMKKEGNKQVPDTDRQLRIEGTKLVPAGTDVAALQLIAPVELPLHRWSLAIKGELLSDDEKQVLATSYTRIRRLPTFQPLQLKVEIPDVLTLRAGDEQAQAIKGSLLRHAGFAHRVQLALRGQPEEVKIPPVTVEPEETEFVLPLRLAADAKQGEFKDVRLVATFVDVGDAIRDVRDQSQAFTLKVVSE